MGILKSRKNKKFSYNPRYYKHEGEGNPYEIRHKFDAFRSTVGTSPGLKGKFKNAWEELKASKNRGVNKRIILITAALVLLFLYIIDFDLSIFFQQY
ncbi:riboflavin synthase subunit beta [Altibacter sp.]|uniref:riboflavin synthase subunit beta n=1 Tax=Altibacter sp. TaxID=2024823 RepID=UPI000C8CB4AD|nr:riboflavin synthase subunit beta [Altibacter sp.]MAP53382.1 riboflavin synthase subunit beta [Altibacter sp.]